MGAHLSVPPRVAFHVLKVQPGSPSAQAGLDPYFDYIVSVQDQTVQDETPNVVAQMAKLHQDKPIQLMLYNSRLESYRQVTMIPSHQWGGDGLLGCSIRFCSYEEASSRVWHILDIVPGSPADDSGLIDHRDYIIGTPHALLLTNEDLIELLDRMDKQLVHLVVYNVDMEKCRDVSIIPNRQWGGDGALGCQIGFGYLHRIPRSMRPVPAPLVADASPKPATEAPDLKSPVGTKVASSLLYLVHDLTTSISQHQFSELPVQPESVDSFTSIPGIPPSPPSPLDDKDKFPRMGSTTRRSSLPDADLKSRKTEQKHRASTPCLSVTQNAIEQQKQRQSPLDDSLSTGIPAIIVTSTPTRDDPPFDIDAYDVDTTRSTTPNRHGVSQISPLGTLVSNKD